MLACETPLRLKVGLLGDKERRGTVERTLARWTTVDAKEALEEPQRPSRLPLI